MLGRLAYFDISKNTLPENKLKFPYYPKRHSVESRDSCNNKNFENFFFDNLTFFKVDNESEKMSDREQKIPAID